MLATLVSMAVTTLQAAPRPRSFVAVRGPDAAGHLNRMVSNEVEAMAVGESCEALLLDAEGADRGADARVAARRGRRSCS